LIQLNHPDSYWANHHLGIALSQLPDYQSSVESLRYLTAAVSLRPQSAGARVNLAEVLLRSGDKNGAKNHLQLSLLLMPGNQTIDAMLKSLTLADNESPSR
jgi:Flp pilus assembly protein TadD